MTRTNAALVGLAVLLLGGASALAQDPLSLRRPPTAVPASPAPPATVDPSVVPPQPGSQPPLPLAAPVMKVVRLGLDQPTPRPAPMLGGADVPADRVVSVPLNKSRPLDLPAEARDIVVGNPEIADVIVRSPRQVFLVGKAVGDTNIFFLDGQGRLIRRIEANVQIDVTAVRQLLRELVPDQDIEVTGVNDSIFLSGTVRSADAAANVRNIARRFVAADGNVVTMLKVAAEQQVLLKVRVAEVQRNVLKELGVQLNAANTFGDYLLTYSGFSVGTSAPSPFAGLNLGIDKLGSAPTAVDLLEQRGLIHSLAEPNLTAISGEQARMLAGGEFPIPVAEDSGKIAFEFKQFGVGLSFLPVVLDRGRISLKLETEVSAISNVVTVDIGGNIRVPSLTVRRASTTVEMPSGGSLMIAGLLQENINSTVAGLPGLMDLPILGTLFRSTSFQRGETELVIMIQAILVQPVDSKMLVAPTDGFVPSSDLDRYLLGRLEEVYARKPGRDGSAAVLQGPFGYIVE